MLAQVVFDRRQRKREGGEKKKKKNQKHKGKVLEFFLIDELLLQKSILSLISHCLGGQKKTTHLCFPPYLCFVMTVKNSLFD